MFALNIFQHILLPSLSFFVLMCVAGLWVDLLWAQRVFRKTARVFLLPVSGAVSLAILITNLSYAGMPAKYGWWMAALALAGLAAALWRRGDGFLAKPKWAGVLLAIFAAGLLAQNIPVVSNGKLTTFGEFDGDWFTYVMHSDYWRDNSYFTSTPALPYYQYKNPIDQYRWYHLRIGASQLFAAYTSMSGIRGMYCFNQFTGLMLAVAMSALGFAAAVFLRTGLVGSLAFGLLYGLHPLVMFASYAAFMPQLLGTAIAFVLLAQVRYLSLRYQALPRWLLFGFFVTGMLVCYVEWLPLVAAAGAVYYLLAFDAVRRRLPRMLKPIGVAALVAVAISPVGVVRGVNGLIQQIALSKVDGGGPQALDNATFFLSSVFGFLRPPAIAERLPMAIADPFYRVVPFELAAVLFLLLLGTNVCRGRRRLPLLLYSGVALLLGIHIQLTYVQYRTWAIFKLFQYWLPAALLLMAAAFLHLWRKKSWKIAVALPVAVLVAHLALNSSRLIAAVSRMSVDTNLPRPSQTVTVFEQQLMDWAAKTIPADQPVLSLTPWDDLHQFTPNLFQVLYPRPVVAIDRKELLSQHFDFRYAVADRNLGYSGVDLGPIVWENERFALYEIAPEKVWPISSAKDPNVLPSGSVLMANQCRPGGKLVAHLYSFEPQTVRLMDAATGGRLVERQLYRESVVVAPFEPDAKGRCKVEFQSEFPVGFFSAVQTSDAGVIQRAEQAMSRMQTNAEVQSAIAAPNASTWQWKRAAGSSVDAAVRIENEVLTVSAAQPASGAVTTGVRLQPGWYLASGEMEILETAKGQGRGFGLGLVGDSTSFFAAEKGVYSVEAPVFIGAAGSREFGALIAGLGSARYKNFALTRMGTAGAAGPARRIDLPAPGSTVWGDVKFDGAQVGPQATALPAGIRLVSQEMTSGGKITTLKLTKGTYLLRGEVRGLAAAQGAGLGYAFGVVGQQGGMLATKAAGRSSLSKTVDIPADGNYGFAIIVGGFGQNSGSAEFSNVELFALPGFARASAAKADPGVLLDGSFDLSKWSRVNFDGAKTQPEMQALSRSVSMESSVPTSFALVRQIQTEKGWYALSADVEITKNAEGAGRGFGITFLTPSGMSWYKRDAGVYRFRKLMYLPRGTVPVAMVFGGYGTVSGAAKFKDLKFERVAPPETLTNH